MSVDSFELHNFWLSKDIDITLWLHRFDIFPSALHCLFTILGSVWFFVSIFLCQLLHRLYKTKTLSWTHIHSLVSLGFFIALTFSLKAFIGRVRPEAFLELNLLGQANALFYPFSFSVIHHSMPSSHSAVLAFMGSYQRKKFWYFLAFLTAFSRVLTLRHFFLDTLVGFIWGISLGIGFSFAREKIASYLLSKNKTIKIIGFPIHFD